MFIAHVGRDQEVLASITKQAAERGVTDAALTLIGAVQECTVSVMPKGDPLDDIISDYDQPFELTGTGEITDGKVHIHVTLGGDGVVVAGHLHKAMVRDWFVRAYVQPLS
ncbi:PCC domain-containing protein [Dactylosporangium sp. CA-152071]|uniref:PCC domain-containing protein n=1 Tax=Dactylosporangium sp. CA-152071 TaxID=3239933 RepID=UPI003D94188E